ncbi:MAG: GspH/FimT family pseudopilin [Gemmatimonadales bacterium]
MRSGLVLIELMLVVVVAGLLALFAAPRLLAVVDAVAVRNETFRVVAALDAARGASIRLGAVATLTLSDTSYQVIAVTGTDTSMAWRRPGPRRSGVVLGGAGQAVSFGPAGLAMGVSNRTITLTKGSAARKVVVSRLGRITY